MWTSKRSPSANSCTAGTRSPTFVERFTNTFSSDYRFELVSELVTGDGLAAEWTVSGHHDHDAPMLPATHEPFTIRGATIARLDNGKFSSSRDYWDMAGFLREVGVLPGRPE